MSTSLYALGIGVGTQNVTGDWLEIFYPMPLFTPSGNLRVALDILAYEPGNTTIALEPSNIPALAEALAGAGETGLANAITPMANSQRPLVAVVLVQDTAPATVPEAYLKLQLLSHRGTVGRARTLDRSRALADRHGRHAVRGRTAEQLRHSSHRADGRADASDTWRIRTRQFSERHADQAGLHGRKQTRD